MSTGTDQIAALLTGLRSSGLSSSEISDRSGLSRTSLWRLESGMAREPSLDTYLAIGRCYERELGRPPPLSYRRR